MIELLKRPLQWLFIQRYLLDSYIITYPSEFEKRAILKDFGANFGLRAFVETGTFRGNTTAAMAPHFDKLFSIEIDPTLAAKATARFADESKIKIVEGDSAKMLPSVLAELDQPALFWLDGHFSGGVTGGGDTDVPIMVELKLIFDHKVKSHVILIDDARLFRGIRGYPTVTRLAKFVQKHAPHYGVSVYADIIRIYNTEYVWTAGEEK